MKKYKPLLLIIFTILLLPTTLTRADAPPENLYTGSSAFYVFSLEANNTVEISLNHSGDGNFKMYLLRAAPPSENINENSSIIIGNYSTDGLYVSHKINSTKMLFVQVKLISNGPDVFWLTSTQNGTTFELTRYYIPQIPGYPIEIILITSCISIGVLYIVKKRKNKIID